ncbi:MAG: glycosyltransferase family 39 protein [Actinobacteria bacterium]|nr:glycosyltransferase family 39 protein [Actinomycetota bacterium]
MVTGTEARRGWVTPAVVAFVLVGIGLRLWLLTSPVRYVDADEAVVGLMARGLLHGRVEAFFWGQDYGGIQEAVLVAGLMKVGLSTFLAMKLVPVGLAAGAAILVWRIGRRLAGEDAGRLAGALSWAAPAASVWLSTKERGFYGATLVLSLLAVLLLLRVDERPNWRDAALFGLAAGSAWYASPQALYLVAPTGVWLVVRAWRTGRARQLAPLAPVAVLGAVAGAFPWLVANLHRDWASLSASRAIPDTSFWDRLELFFRQGLPVLVGLRHPVTPVWSQGAAGRIAYYAVALPGLVAVAALAWRRTPKLTPIVLAMATYPIVFAVFPTSFTVADPRYLTFLAPLVALVVGWALVRGPRPLVAVGLVFVLGTGVVGTGNVVDRADVLGNWDVAAGNLDPLLATLEHEQVDRMFADYWIAHRVDLESGERLIATPLEYVRHQAYEGAVRAEERPAYVLFRGTTSEQRLGAYLGTNHIGFDRFDAGIYVVYRPHERVLPERVEELWAKARGFPSVPL